MNVMCFALFNHFLRPYGNLNFADMSLSEEKHAKSALSDTSADGVRKSVFYYGLLEIQFGSFGTSLCFKLSLHCL